MATDKSENAFPSPATAAPMMTPVLPDWLERWNRLVPSVAVPRLRENVDLTAVPQDAVVPYDWFTPYYFTFLGRDFRVTKCRAVERVKSAGPPAVLDIPPIAAQGIAKEFAEVLVEAQNDIFAAYFASARKHPWEVKEQDFKDWCSEGTSGESIIGWRFGAGRHAYGMAVDLDYKRNPHVAMGLVGNPSSYGGEDLGTSLASQATKLRAQAIEAYDMAMQVSHGVRLDSRMSRVRGSRSYATVWEDLASVNDAVKRYIRLAFDESGKDMLASQESWGGNSPVSPQVFEKRRAAMVPPSHPSSTMYLDHRDLYHRIVADYDKLRAVMVFGKTAPGSGRGLGAFGVYAKDGTRDPFRGFLSLRKDIVLGILTKGPGGAKRVPDIRWGACDFGFESGDIMHFDRELLRPEEVSPSVELPPGAIWQ
jgi:hypothetical protein